MKDDRRGNVPILFGLMITPIFAMTGLSIDFTRAQHAKTALQHSLDAAAVAGAGANGDDAAKRSVATAAFTATYNADKHGATTPTITVSDDTLSIQASTTVDNSFAGLVGFDQFTVSAASAAHEAPLAATGQETASCCSNGGISASMSTQTLN